MSLSIILRHPMNGWLHDHQSTCNALIRVCLSYWRINEIGVCFLTFFPTVRWIVPVGEIQRKGYDVPRPMNSIVHVDVEARVFAIDKQNL